MLVGVLAALTLATGCSGGSSPRAMHPTPTPTARPGFGEVITYSPGPGRSVFAVTWAGIGEDTCGACVTLWRTDSGRAGAWTRVHDFAKPRHPSFDDGTGPLPPLAADGLAMARDGRNGLLAFDGAVLHTTDGGETWREAALPGDPGTDGAYVLATSTHLFVLVSACDHSSCAATHLFRSAPTGDLWTEAALPPGFREVDDLAAQGGTLTAVSDVDARPIQRSRDGGEHWSAVPVPRHCFPAQGGIEVLLASCTRGQWADSWVAVHDHGRWRRLYDAGPGPEASVGPVLSIADTSFLVSLTQGMRLVGPSGRASPVRTGFTGYWDAGGFIDARTGYRLQGGTLRVSRDGGRTWTALGQPL